jgi:hypothetical protein
MDVFVKGREKGSGKVKGGCYYCITTYVVGAAEHGLDGTWSGLLIVSYRRWLSSADSYACALSRRPDVNPPREPETPVASVCKVALFPWAACVPVLPPTRR